MLVTVAVLHASWSQRGVTLVLAARILLAVCQGQFQPEPSIFVQWLRRLVAGLSSRGARVRSKVSLCDICGGQNGTERGLSASSSIFTFQYHAMPFLSSFWNYCYQNEKRTKPGNLPKSSAPSAVEGARLNISYHFFVYSTNDPSSVFQPTWCCIYLALYIPGVVYTWCCIYLVLYPECDV
jgi:hypothetical protein